MAHAVCVFPLPCVFVMTAYLYRIIDVEVEAEFCYLQSLPSFNLLVMDYLHHTIFQYRSHSLSKDSGNVDI